MATHAVDQKLLGKLAEATAPWDPQVSQQLFVVLGLSTRLDRHLIRAHRLRNIARSVDEDEIYVKLTDHIIFLAREGLSCTENHIMPASETQEASAELRVFATKLRASFFHIFCIFRNSPPIHQQETRLVPKDSARTVTAGSPNLILPTHERINLQPSANSVPSNIQNTTSVEIGSQDGSNGENTSQALTARLLQQSDLMNELPQSPISSEHYLFMKARPQRLSAPPPLAYKQTPGFRNTIPSIVSDTSFVTNPWANIPVPALDPADTPPKAKLISPREHMFNVAQGMTGAGGPNPAIRDTISSIMTNPYDTTDPLFTTDRSFTFDRFLAGLTGTEPTTEGLRDPIPSIVLSEASYITNPYANLPPAPTPAPITPLPRLPAAPSPRPFLITLHNYIPNALALFSRASDLARTHLPGSSPLRLSVACEHAALLAEVGDVEGCREVARAAVEARWMAEQREDELDDAVPFAEVLGRMARGVLG